ncbi:MULTISPECIES: plasmid transfer protein TraA [unclassified Streptomyces]|uniref:plasmid transfer protein TraA n=1 Tax=unclassified Streptomyces TaxID=2593676 RepID=UPI000938AA80|nr:plasmid transfer protein TraA [Streptomyces sp. TSRI0107]OKJ67519.1 sporulation protein SsgA [Streptomyces sp. TSRI0107]
MSTPTTAATGGKNSKNDSAKFGASFAPSFTLNLSQNKTTTNGGGGSVPAQGGRGGHSEALLPPPEFTSPSDVRNYCNHLRAVMVTISFEVAMGAEILKGVLATVPDPEGRIGGSKARAWRVSRKLTKAADAAASAAKNAAATYAKFQQEYEEEINRVKHRARRPQGPRMDWARQ